MAKSFTVEVVSPERRVWGPADAVQVIATTTEGEIGILAGHIPLIAELAAGRVEVTTVDGRRRSFVVDGGFLSVTPDKTAIISPYVQRAEEVSLEQATAELRQVRALIDAGDNSDETKKRYHRANAQVKAASQRD